MCVCERGASACVRFCGRSRRGELSPTEDSGYGSVPVAAVTAVVGVQQNYYYNKTTTQDHSFQVYSETRAVPVL